MVPLQYLLAAALLSAPPGVAEITLPAPVFRRLQPALQTLAIDWEILDARESNYLLRDPEALPWDLHLLHQRHRSLADAPPVQDCSRFPDPPTVAALIAFNRAYRAHLESCRAVDLGQREEVGAALEETDRLYRTWDTIREACSDYRYVKDRREALKRLRDLLGPEAYYTGPLPPSVPVWRFRTIE
jgi:hypothetical protein